MPNWNLKTDEGLREACEEAAQRIPDERVAEVAEFLHEIEKTPAEQRNSAELHRKLWMDNPIVPIRRARKDKGFENAAFHAGFNERIGDLPDEDDEGRPEALWKVFWGTLNDPLVAGKDEVRRPRQRVLRGLATLFPREFAGETDHAELSVLRDAIIGRRPNPTPRHTETSCRNQLLDSLETQGRLERALGQPREHHEIAKRLLVCQELATNLPYLRERVWLARAGKHGQDEPTAMREEISILGFTEVGDLTKCVDRDAIKQLARRAYPDATAQEIGSCAGQLWRFRHGMRVGDVAVLPQKRRPGQILLGRIGSWYESREMDGKTRHTRSVKWLGEAPKEQFSQELQIRFLNAPPTVKQAIREGGDEVKRVLEQGNLSPVPRRPSKPIQMPDGIVARVRDAAAKRGLRFEDKLIERLHLGLWANERRHFAVLAGLSGSGKTQLAMEYARALTGAETEKHERLCAVSAAPGWHDPTSLLGYVNPLDGTYVRTQFLEFLLAAAENPDERYCCVLDEMNLSHPEQYLAPILSAMEREGGTVEFHDSDAKKLGVPRRIEYPSNLVLLGTVNMDETTMGLSDKVLDRAFVLEFWDIEVAEWPGWVTTSLSPDRKKQVQSLLEQLMAALRPAKLHFGWRVIDEFVRLMELHEKEGHALAATEALDEVTYAKVLPKLRGDDSLRFRRALEACEKVVKDAGLSESAKKVKELHEDLDETGSFRFWR